MRELKDEKLKYKLDKIYKNILKLKRLDVDNYYCANLLDWFNEVILKNIAIYKSKKSEEDIDQELFKKSRQYVYWIDFGRNIGSEFRDLHFAVVIYESKYSAFLFRTNINLLLSLIPKLLTMHMHSGQSFLTTSHISFLFWDYCVSSDWIFTLTERGE